MAKVNSIVTAVVVCALMDTLGLIVMMMSMSVWLFHRSVKGAPHVLTSSEASTARVRSCAQRRMDVTLVVAAPALEEGPAVVRAQMISPVTVQMGSPESGAKTF